MSCQQVNQLQVYISCYLLICLFHYILCCCMLCAIRSQIPKINPMFPTDANAGFTQEWSSGSNQRVARRQIEVQANNTGNSNRSTEYRTITTDPEQSGSANPRQQTVQQMEEEESKFNQSIVQHHLPLLTSTLIFL